MNRIPRRWLHRSLLAGTVAVALAATGVLALQTAHAQEGGELVVNGTFDDGLNGGWWSTGNVTMSVVDGRLCANVPGGTANPWDAIVGQNDIELVAGDSYAYSFEASGDPAGNVRAIVGLAVAPFDTYFAISSPLSPAVSEHGQSFDASTSTEQGQVAFQLGGSATPWTFCVDNVSLKHSVELVRNGTFDDGLNGGWWSTGNVTMSVVNGRLCANIPGGTANPWDAIVGQNDIPLVAGDTYAYSLEASGDPAGQVRAIVGLAVAPFDTYFAISSPLTPTVAELGQSFDAPVSTEQGQVAFQVGGSATPWTFCVDNVSLRGAAGEGYTPDTGPRVRVNQVAYLPNGPKNATLVTESTTALAWQLRNDGGTVVASGTTTPRGVDATSGENVHSINFSGFTSAGAGFTLTADGETSHPFDIDGAAYAKLRHDALKFYYTQRSGTEILDGLRPGYGRAAGHIGVAPNTGDNAVGCPAEYPAGGGPGCDYTLDVTGGWYDAGDHGKYVVNGGISVHQLMSEFERTKVASTAKAATLGDSTLNLPESGNGVPDILDEARWELEFLLSMQVPAGKPLAGMAHHKIHDDNWTGLPLMPAADPQPRHLHKPSTAATLNLAATAAQCARLFAPYDAAFADQCLAAARTAWAAAKANPAIYATSADGTGGGPYDDDYVADEFYWAAAELYITTGEKKFADEILASPVHSGDAFRAEGFDWKWTGALGRLELATIPNGLSGRDAVRASVLAGAEKYLAAMTAHPYGLPYAPPSGLFDWGSNNLVLNNMVVMATAYDISGDEKYRDGVLQGMDYILGRNALNQSYVTGYGENASENQHSRWYAHQLNAALPNPPVGTLSGGPNSSIQDPVAQALLKGCKPQFCYIDDIESWSTNELTINWNSPLSWIAAFIADQGDATPPPAPRCSVQYSKASLFGLFVGAVTVRNTGSTPVNGWTLQWAFIGDQAVQVALGADVSSAGATVTARNESFNARINPGQSATFGFIGTTSGANPVPGLFLLNGGACG
jgi:endoglucanase